MPAANASSVSYTEERVPRADFWASTLDLPRIYAEITRPKFVYEHTAYLTYYQTMGV